MIVYPKGDSAVNEVLEMGCWTNRVAFGDHEKGWHAKILTPKADQFDVLFQKNACGTVKWSLLGHHNIQNALAAIAAAQHVGVDPKIAIEALSCFKGVKRRMEIKGIQQGITVYDDFAHHPTAIETTLAGLRAKVGDHARILVVLDIRANTMRLGHHKEKLGSSVDKADQVYFFHSPDITWDVNQVWNEAEKPGGVYTDTQLLIKDLIDKVKQHDHVIFMSNGGFNGIHTGFLEHLKSG